MIVSGRLIKAARALLGWSQGDLAERAGISRSALARLEFGGSDIRVSTVNAVVDALERNGLEILQESNARGEGVRLLKPRKGKAAE